MKKEEMILLKNEELQFQSNATVAGKTPAIFGTITVTNQRFIWNKTRGVKIALAAGVIGLASHALREKNFSLSLEQINQIRGVEANGLEFITNDGNTFKYWLDYKGFSRKNATPLRDEMVNYIQNIIDNT